MADQITGSKTPGRRMEGRRVIVTGAASGIGRATARLMAREGAKLALFDINEAGLSPVAKETGGIAILCNQTDSAAVDAAVAKAVTALGGLDGLVNTAGIIISGNLAATTDDIWRRVVETNLFGPFYLCRATMPHLQKTKGATVVNLASGAALVPNSGSLSYAASKGGIVGMTKSLAMTCAPNVRVNAIAPGSVNTPLITDRNGGKIPAGTAERYALKRVAEPEEIADAIQFLSCVESSFVTGSTLAVDGGRTFH